ncbi:MAG TPA: hypothetical protein VM509_15620 [Planctomycetota bacterium]|nr:hypothetical protein [Planctomycetota bacterium]
MIHGETPLPERHPGSPGDSRCHAARADVAKLLSSGRTLADEPALREHLKTCLDCNAAYRSALLDDARLRRRMVDVENEEARHESPSAPRRAVLSPLAIARAGFATSAATGRATTAWMIVILIAGYAAVRLTPGASAGGRATLQALAGEISTLGDPLLAGAPARDLSRGDWVRLPAGARARLCFGATKVELAACCELQIEEPSTRRVRLELGEIEVFGPLLVTSSYGIVQVEDGHATVGIDVSGLRVEAEDGNVRTIDSHGEHELESGESAQLALARW